MTQPNPAAMTFLAQRRSHSAKLFTGKVPNNDELAAILTAALRVPDHGKLEPWRLVVLHKDVMPRLASLAEVRAHALGGDREMVEKGRGHFDRGHLAVVVISDPKPVEKIPQVEQLLSAGALCMGVVNAAEAAGWGANWLTGWPSHDRPFIAEAFGCTETESVAGIIHIGTPPDSEAPDRPRPDPARVIRWLTE